MPQAPAAQAVKRGLNSRENHDPLPGARSRRHGHGTCPSMGRFRSTPYWPLGRAAPCPLGRGTQAHDGLSFSVWALLLDSAQRVAR